MTADTSNGGQGITEAMSKLRTTDGEEAKEVANGDHSDETMISAGKFTLQQMTKQGKGKTHPLDWGYPGELTKEEAAVFARFRDEVEKRGGEFRKTVYSFGETEGEGWALTRWLRARKYKYDRQAPPMQLHRRPLTPAGCTLAPPPLPHSLLCLGLTHCCASD